MAADGSGGLRVWHENDPAHVKESKTWSILLTILRLKHNSVVTIDIVSTDVHCRLINIWCFSVYTVCQLEAAVSPARMKWS
jgi:hypothetical protein